MPKLTFEQRRRKHQGRPYLVCYTIVFCMVTFMGAWLYMFYGVLVGSDAGNCLLLPPTTTNTSYKHLPACR